MKVSFNDVEPQLKEKFDLLMNNPSNKEFDLAEEDVKQIEKLTEYAKRAGYKLLVKQTKAAISKQNNEEMAKTIKIDLEEDKVFIKDKKQLEKMFKNPEQEKWKLEPEMVTHIQKMSQEEKNDLMMEFAEENNIDMRSIGKKLLEGIKSFFSKIAPVFEKILDSLGILASDIAVKSITKKMGDTELSKTLQEGTKTLIKEGTNTIKDTTEILVENIPVNSAKTEEKEDTLVETKEEKVEPSEIVITENHPTTPNETKLDESVNIGGDTNNIDHHTDQN